MPKPSELKMPSKRKRMANSMRSAFGGGPDKDKDKDEEDSGFSFAARTKRMKKRAKQAKGDY